MTSRNLGQAGKRSALAILLLAANNSCFLLPCAAESLKPDYQAQSQPNTAVDIQETPLATIAAQDSNSIAAKIDNVASPSSLSSPKSVSSPESVSSPGTVSRPDFVANADTTNGADTTNSTDITTGADTAASAISGDEFSRQYTQLTKKILSESIALERYSLNYRLENTKRSRACQLLYFGSQEASAATLLAFEVIAMKEFDKGRKRPLTINQNNLKGGLRAAQVGSIIAASGSGMQLAVNAARYIKAKQKGYDTASANRRVTEKLKEIDRLMAERDKLISANTAHPGHGRALIESKILLALRESFVDEYAQFSANSRSEAAARNLFFLMNCSYNVIGAVGAGLGYKAVTEPTWNGPSNICFTISGAMAMGTPLLASALLWTERQLILKAQKKRKLSQEASLQELEKEIRNLHAVDGDNTGALIPTLPSTQRFALYSQSGSLFTKQLENEMTTIHRLNKVAVQSSVTGPIIGGLLMTQGILGTRGYYKYFPSRPRKQLDLGYKGAIVGTVGSSLALVGNVAWLLASINYENRLRKNNSLPEQLIADRLKHLDEVEKIVSAL
ncbi:MAG: hypothetical protein LCH63_18340 [Candidatus Melainabacteria bacterium]|nr:hypothetical protein [Candidatus Melainabacteria bacterium]